MPASLLTEILFRGAFEVVFYGLGYLIGWVVVPIFSLGYYSVEPWDFSNRKKSKGRSRLLLPKQISADAACGVGLVTLAMAGVVGYFIWRAAGV
nr:putative integron gene cassette protein [uncultured bacterium]